MFNSIYKRYNLFNFLAFMFFGYSAINIGIFITNNNTKFLLVSIIYILLCFIFAIYETKYFNKTYQLKKNAKKEFTKENKNK